MRSPQAGSRAARPKRCALSKVVEEVGYKCLGRSASRRLLDVSARKPSKENVVKMISSVALAVTAASLVSAQTLNLTNTTSRYINYTAVTGYFLQDDPTTNASTFDYVSIKQ